MSRIVQRLLNQGRSDAPNFLSFISSSKSRAFPLSSGSHFPHVTANNEVVRRLLSDTSLSSWRAVWDEAIDSLELIEDEVNVPSAMRYVRTLTLSPELEAWRDEQHRAGRILPNKGDGLARVSDAVLKMMDAKDWPPALQTACAFYRCYLANVLVEAHNPDTLYSNYYVDLGFFYEHGYQRIFPDFVTTVQSQLANPVARATPGGTERRDVAKLSFDYTRRKVELEENEVGYLPRRTARLSRRALLSMYLFESGMCGMAAEMMERGWDPTSTATAFILTSPGTDVVDVGCDLHNGELLNSFLNTADVTDSGVVTEEALQRVYDAYASCVAPMFTEQYNSPGARVLALLYTWHIHNDRHHFLRRAVLGYSKIRRGLVIQRKAGLDEVFDNYMHTTGRGRPLPDTCNGKTICDHVQGVFDRYHNDPMLLDFWHYAVERPEQYVSKGMVDQTEEDDIAGGLSIAMARAITRDRINELAWLLCHASQHAWQVNRLFEAAMFGSLLDDGGLMWRLDRAA